MGLRLGICQTAYSQLERGVAAISPERLRHLAEILEVEVSQLLDFDYQMVLQPTAPESAALTDKERQYYERTIQQLQQQIRSLMSKSGGGGILFVSWIAYQASLG
jgi:transcriptional regulator with XRE-family HTH domain